MFALEGIRVLDFSWAYAGPYATTLLRFLGAEVIKVESQSRLDISRTSSLRGAHLSETDQPYFAFVNPNKLSITLNLKRPEAVELAKRLAVVSNVVVESYRPGVMNRLGLGYLALKEIKPDIIYLSTSAAGDSGPEALRVGYAPLFSAVAGLGEMTGYFDGPPTEMRVTSDFVSSFSSAFAIVAALNYWDRTGQGQYIDLSSEESVACLIGEAIMDYTMNGRVQSRRGNRDDIMAPHNCYRCRGEDKWVSIAISSEEEWKSLCQGMGDPEWAKQEKFSDAYMRWLNQEELDKLVEGWTQNYTHYEVMDILQRVGVAAVPSLSNEELFSDPHLIERQVYYSPEQPNSGVSFALSPPWRLSVTPVDISGHAPLLGEHNEYVFHKLLGLPQQEIARLKQEGIIY